MSKRISFFFKDNRCIFAAFLIAAASALIAMIAEGIYPFGTQQIAIIDMYHQYLPFLSELQDKLQSGGSLFFSWNGGGGSNFWNLIAYYGASPLNLLLAIFPKSLIMEAVTSILLLKIGLAAAFMAVFLRYAYGKGDTGTAVFAVLYALCSYVMAYYWCIMWMDAVMLLPLCMTGLHKLIDEGKFSLYTVSLALIVFSNYYIAIMVCIFILCYYPVLYFIKVKNGGVRRCLLTTGKAAGCSLLGIAMSAVMLLPTYISMQDTYYISAEMPEVWKTYNDPLSIVNQLLPNAQLTVRSGLPNLYCGLIVVILLVFFITSRTILLREKTLDLVFLAFMFLSLNLNKLDFIWHGFHFPNQLPYRYTFVICFVLVGIAYRTFLRVDEFRLNAVWGVLAAGIGYYLIAHRILKDDVDDPSLFFYCGVAFLILYCAVFVVYRKGYVRKPVFVFLIAVVIIAEMISNTSTSFDRNGTTSRETYFENYSDIVSLTDSVKDEFVRTELDGSNVLNCPAFYGYKGISQFSSTLNAGTTEFMEKIGLDGEPGKNRFTYNRTAPVVDSLLNVKYLISKNRPLDDEDHELVKQEGNSYLYKNRYPLAAGYVLGESIRTWDTGSDDPFDVLNDYVRAATDGSCSRVFYDAGKPELITDHAEVKDDGGKTVTAIPDESSSEKSVIMRYKASKTQKYYVFVEAGHASEITVRKGSDIDDISLRNDCGSVVDIGKIEKGKTFDIIIKYDTEA
ncbi:MAG: YfhO family protein [Anaerovoracaceae bacterium]